MQRPKILLIDNYDSFVWNLAHYLYHVGAEVQVERNDTLDVDGFLGLAPDAIVISPGPCSPTEAGQSVPLVKAAMALDMPVLGVCLGHQAIVAAFGGTVGTAKEIRHGKTSEIRQLGGVLFQDIPRHLNVVRYHSLAAVSEDLPDCLQATAHTDDGEIMALQHKSAPIHGVQFHPESIKSEYGYMMLENWLNIL